jgi:hypothetical protein
MGAYIVLSNAVGALPMPDTTSSKFYAWFFKFANAVASNLTRASAGKIPGGADVMPLPGAQDAVNQAAMVARVAQDRPLTPIIPKKP